MHKTNNTGANTNASPLSMDYLFGIICFSFIVLIQSIASGQDSIAVNVGANEENRIQWVGQYPSDTKEKNSENIFIRFANWVVGKKEVPALIRPISILASSTDSFLIVDQGNRIILDVVKNKARLLKIFGRNTNNFSSLVGICALPENEILFTDSRTNKIYSLVSDKKNYHILNDSLLLQQPTGILYSKLNDEIWVTETSAHRIVVLDRKGNLKKIIGARGEGNGEFNFPTFICIDKEGNVYVNDAMNFRIQIFDKNGDFVSSFGKAGDATGYFASSKGIAVDSHQNIYIVDALFNTIQIFDRFGNFLYNFGQQGREKEQFMLPAGIYIDTKDYIYVADSYNSRVQIFQLINSAKK